MLRLSLAPHLSLVAALLLAGCNPPAPNNTMPPQGVPGTPAVGTPGTPAVGTPKTPSGDPVGTAEQVLPADKAPSDAPLRPFKETPIYNLTNLRVGNFGPGPGLKLMVHYERMSGEEPGAGPALVIRTPDGNERTTVGGFGPFQGKKKAGDMVVDFGFSGRPGGVGNLNDVEVYFVQSDRRWEDEGFRPKFKVSNSVVIGTMGRPVQFAREWKPDETAKLNDPPPTAPGQNANANVGEDTDFVGHTMGLLPAVRFADPAKRPVIGVLYNLGQGEADKGQKIQCVNQFGPMYDKRQPRYNQQVVFAKPGYAVGALNVKTKKIVTAVQVVFMKQKPDGTMDPADSYTSKWLGHPEEGDKEGKITGEGRKVIGMHLKNFGALFAVALVLD